MRLRDARRLRVRLRFAVGASGCPYEGAAVVVALHAGLRRVACRRRARRRDTVRVRRA
jgi:hypothetical protein